MIVRAEKPVNLQAPASKWLLQGSRPVSLQIVPEPPNRTAAHTVSQPHRDKKHIMRVGSDKAWMSEAAIAAGNRVGSRGSPRAAPHVGRVAARLYPTPGAPARATTRRESRQIHALSHVR
jgi:hypothetical protein